MQDQERTNDSNAGQGHEFNINVDGVPFFVRAQPFEFNSQVRYNVSVNEADPDIFVWDDSVGMFRALDDSANTLPDGLIREINTRLFQLTQSNKSE